MRIIQILNKPKKTGGIQYVANVLQRVLCSKGFDNLKTDISFSDLIRLRWTAEDNILIVHGMSNLITLRALLLVLFDRVSFRKNKFLIWQPHFHPFKYHKRPNLARLYFYLINIPLGILANKIIVITPIEYEYLNTWFNSAKLELIPNPVELVNSNYEADDCIEVGGRYILAVGRNEYSKRLQVVAEYSSEIKGLGCKTVIVSSGFKPQHQDCLVLSDCSDYMLHRLYQGAECVVIPSLYEAFSLVAVESMMLGKRVVCRENLGAAGFEAVKPLCVFSDFTLRSYVNSVSAVLSDEPVESSAVDAVCSEFHVDAYADRWEQTLRFETL